MSALSFLSKKSWHTGLQTNQKAVWEAEKAALEERKKLEELRKERERERELQELERMNEQSGRARRQERVDWMYNAPASGSNVNQDELEDYLLGKKRVDKLLKGDETNDLSRSARQAGGAAVRGDAVGIGASISDRDLASKVREDPMLSIRQQEQAAYEALLKDPARLRAMRKAAGLGAEESKEERRRRKEEKRRQKEESNYRQNSDRRAEADRDRDHDKRRSEQGISRHRDEDRLGRREYGPHSHREDRSDARESSSRLHPYSHDHHERHFRRHRQEERVDEIARRSRSRSCSPRRDERDRRGPHRSLPRTREPVRRIDTDGDSIPTREARLAAMQQNATELSSSRKSYLAKVEADERADLAREEALRQRVRESRASGRRQADGQGFGSAELKGSFMLDQERTMYGSSGGSVDLAERLRRGRDTLQRFDND